MLFLYSEKNCGTASHLVDMKDTYLHYRDVQILDESQDLWWQSTDKPEETPNNKKKLFAAISKHPPNIKDTARLTPIMALAAQIFGASEPEAINFIEEDIEKFYN